MPRLLVDDRVGSRELLRPLKRAGTPAQLQRLRFADFSFWGHGPRGRVRVGVERKTISEILTAITDSRFTGHQLPGLLKAYDYTYLVVEGNYYPDPASGILMVNGRAAGHTRQGHLFENAEKFLMTLELKAGLRVRRTNTPVHTALWIAALYRWWQKRWSEHKSAYVVDETKPDRAILDARTMKRKVANQLTGLAWVRSVKADSYFPSIAAMAVGDPRYQATKDELATAQRHWQTALGFKKGTATATSIVDVCHRRDDVKGKGR